MNLLLVHEVAEILNCHVNTVRNLEKNGKLSSYRDYRGYRLFDRKDVELLKKRRQRIRESNAILREN